MAIRFAAEASKSHENAESPFDPLVRGHTVRQEKTGTPHSSLLTNYQPFTANMKDYIKYLLLLFAAGFLAYWTLAWPMLNLWLQELQVVPDGNQSLPYTIPILILLFAGGVCLCLVALRSRFKSIRIFAHALLIAFFAIILLLFSFHTLQKMLPLGQLTTLLLLYVIVGVIYVRLLYVNSLKKESPQSTDEKDN